MYSWLKKYVDPIIPLFSIVPLLSCFALNMVVYSGTMILCDDWYHHDFTSSWTGPSPLCHPGSLYILAVICFGLSITSW